MSVQILKNFGLKGDSLSTVNANKNQYLEKDWGRDAAGARTRVR